MTKTLYLLRHADASEKAPRQADKERVLSKKGIAETRLAAAFLKKINFSADAIFCSTAVRTRQTLMLITEQLQNNTSKIFYSDNLYEAVHDDLQQLITEVDDQYNTIMIVGHNPAISSLATNLTGKAVSMHTCGLAKIDLDISSWREIQNTKGSLITYTDPTTRTHNHLHA